MGLSNYPPGVTGNEPEIQGWPEEADMMEAQCTRCKETFVPHSPDPEDLIHGETEAGTPCGGIGVIQGEWIAPGTQEEYTERVGDMVNLTAQEKHGLEMPNCDSPNCPYHFPGIPDPRHELYTF